MNTTFLSRWLVVSLVALILSRLPAAESRPNLVFIYADDLRWDTLGVVQREQGKAARFPWLQTPHLDRLAGESVRFRQAFVVTSLCSPGRATVMTGRHAHHTGIVGNRRHLPTDTVTFARHLRDAEYTTAYYGKWHMGDQRERPDYDQVASYVGQGRYFDCPFLVNGRETRTTGWVDDVSTDYAIDFLEGHPKAKPFFVWLGFKSPHGPRGGANLPERVRQLYRGERSGPTPNLGQPAVYAQRAAANSPELALPQDSEAHRDYMRHVTAIDECVGRFLAALERTGHAGNTVVILTSDNGYYLGEHGLGDKRSAYDESLRVPLLIRLPGGASRGGAVHDAMTLNTDYAPTLLDFARAAPLPEAQGRTLRPLLDGRTPGDWRTQYFYSYYKEGNYAAPTLLALRTATHKLITYPGHRDWTEVFDLRRDPYEIRNLAGQADLLRDLTLRLDEEASAVGFRWPPGFGPNGEAPPAPPAKQKKKKRN